jgi:hypothetical protein
MNQSTSNNAENSNRKTGKSGEKIPRKSPKRKTPKEVMNQHIKDEKDVITEEEFKNVVVGTDMEVEKDTAHEPLEIEENKHRPKDEDKDPKIVTPWDVIS